MKLLIAGYGGTSGHTAGLYDDSTNQFIWESGLPSISYLCADENSGLIFGAGEHLGFGKVYMFAADGNTITLVDTLSVSGGALCHISYSPKHKTLAGACYENGDFFAVKVTSAGFGDYIGYFRLGGEEVPLSRAHCATFGVDEDTLYAANIALDGVYCYESATLRKTALLPLDKGAGPRHVLAFPEDLYVITEYSNEIYHYKPSISTKAAVGRVNMLPEGFSDTSYGSTLCYLPAAAYNAVPNDNDANKNMPHPHVNTSPEFTGWLYAANRGADTIAVFQRKSDGSLVKIQDASCAGHWPRHIEIIPVDGGAPLLAVANERSHRVSLCAIEADGRLGEERMHIPFEGASFVQRWNHNGNDESVKG